MVDLNKQEAIQQCKDLVSRARIEEALHVLQKAFNKAEDRTVNLKSQLSNLKKQREKGVIQISEFNTEYARISDSIIGILKELEIELRQLNESGKPPPKEIITKEAATKKTITNDKTKSRLVLYGLSGIILAISIALGIRFFFPNVNTVERISGDSNLPHSKLEKYEKGIIAWGSNNSEDAKNFITQFINSFSEKDKNQYSESYCQAILDIINLHLELVTENNHQKTIQKTEQLRKEIEDVACNSHYYKSATASIEKIKNVNF